MRTVKEFKDAGVVFVSGDEGNDFYVSAPVSFNEHSAFDYGVLIKFAWRDLTKYPDNPQYKIELDIANHRWRPSLNQGEEWHDEQRVKCTDSIKTDVEQVIDFDVGADQLKTLSVNKLEFEAHKANTETLFKLTRFLVDNKIGCIGECCVDIAIREIAEKYNIQKKTITVNGFEVPEPVRGNIFNGEKCFFPWIYGDGYFKYFYWAGETFDKTRLDLGLIHKTENAAIAHAKAMLGIDPNEQA